MFSKNFEIENNSQERKNKTISLVITVAIHACILLFLCWIAISTPDPPFQDNEGGMAVNFGTSEVGSGDVQPTSLVPVEVQPTVTETAPPEPVSTATEKLETQETEDAPVLETKKKESQKPVVKPNEDAVFKPHPKPTKAEPAPVKTPQADENALFKKGGAKGAPNNSTGDGEGGGKGDQGDPNGDPNSKSYKGNGTGNGIGNGSGLGNGSFKLAGRNARVRAKANNPCAESRGKVVVTIKVNKEGKVTSTSYAQAGSTTTDDCLVEFSRKLASQWVFDAKEDAPDTQTGSITFKYDN